MSEVEMEKPASYDVFISYYSGSARDFARYLKKSLMDFGLTSFLDEEDIPKSIEKATDEWRSYIDNSIEKSANFILLMTHGFNKRQEVMREIKKAIEAGKKMFLFKHEPLGIYDLTIEIDNKPIDLSKYEYTQFNNENDLVRKVIASLLGKIGQKRESSFMNQ
ncbi:MAG TPA: toll/interleukin-1 receptor domain-containing protein, partial [archaeon]|nr:toll/interleukin-1 receptor domain-containing protein [archaeon]